MSRYGVRLLMKDGDFVKDTNGRFMTTKDYERKNQSLAKFPGYFNVLFALSDRLLTPKGSLVFHPDYGSNLHLYVGRSNSPENREMIKNEIKDSLLEDPMVKEVSFVGVEQRDNRLLINVNVVLVGQDEVIPFVFPEIFVS